MLVYKVQTLGASTGLKEGSFGFCSATLLKFSTVSSRLSDRGTG